jgi:coenzyme F420-reducing hydrogenase beta subunit
MAATDDERELSSSGGVFPVLAKSVLAENGVVFGAAWNDDFSVSIRGIEDEEGLGALRSSKYVQSSTEQTFNEVKKHLGDGRRVLYSGCPCQIAGLKASLGELFNDKNLLTAEVICHGAPSTTVLQDYLDEAFGMDNVESVIFRDKEAFGWTAGEKVILKDGTEVRQKTSPYTAAFHPLLSVGRACGICPFSRLPRQADLSLGDFWGIGKFRPDLLDHKGLSVVLVNSPRGQQALDGVRESFQVDEIVPVEYATEINKTIVRPFENNPGRKHFFLSRGLKPFQELTQCSLFHHYDIGIVGLWYGINYGSVLTYYALYELMRSLGKDPVMLPKPNGMWGERFNDPNTIAQKFIMERCNAFLPYPSLMEYAFANDTCDAFVLGSDVVWSYEVCGSAVDQFFFLDWVKRSRKKIAYAASVGDGLGHEPKYIEDAKRNLRLFDAISAREEEGAEELRTLTGRDDISCVLDPVFLCGADMFSSIADEAQGDDVASEGVMFAYILQGEMIIQKRHWSNLIAEHLNTERFAVGNASNHYAAHALIGEDAILEIPVEGWIKSIRDSKFYFGDSYHGLCFALMFHVPFVIVYQDEAPAKSRMTSLLGLLDLRDRMIEDEHATDEDVLAIVDSDIDWDKVDEILAREADKSRKWLTDALADASVKRLSDYDYAHDEMIERIGLHARNNTNKSHLMQEQIDDLRTRLDEAEEREAKRAADEARRMAEFEAVLNSKSFQIGRMMTWLPRHLRDYINGL